ncbi:MAG: hypothetical protein ACYC3I_00205 [Gemmataceae bacterium]
MLDQTRQRGAALSALLLPLLVVFVLIVCLFLLVCLYLVDATAFNSDNLLTSAQCDDLLHGRDVTDWHLPGAPYLFPDLLLLMPCQLLTPTLPIAFLVYCLLLHLTLAASLAWLGRISGLRWPTAIVAASCGSIFLIGTYLNKVMVDRACLLVHPGSHLSALLIGVFLLALTTHFLRSGLSWSLASFYLLIGGFGSFSDRLVVVQLLVPLTLALILLAARRIISLKQAGVQIGLLASSFLSACAINWFFQRLGFHLLDLETSSQRLHLSDFFSMLSRLYQGVSQEHLLCILIVLHLLAALAILAFRARRAAPSSKIAELNCPVILLATLTFVLSPPCILGALFVLGMSRHEAIFRYTLSCWFLPPLLLPLLAHWLPGRTARVSAIVLQAGILLFALQRMATLLPDIDGKRFEQPYPPLAQALDRLARERGPLNGLANFWVARSTSWFTREKVAINALSVICEPTFHASNPARFLPGDDLRLPKYQFVVLRPGPSFGPSAAIVAMQYGSPCEKIAVGSDEIWLYDSLHTPMLDRFLRARLADRLHRRLSFTGPEEPACLAHPKASMTPLDAPGCVGLEPGQSCEIRFASAISGQLLDVGASAEARLEAAFFHGDELLATMPVPRVPWTGASYNKPGIQSRLLPLPAVLRQRPWDRILVRAQPDCDNIRLGHILVFAENIAGLDEERPLPRLPRLRLEAEELLPIISSPFWSNDADAAASGGGVRRALGKSPCCIGCTPRLFLQPGRYRLETTMKVDSNSSSEEVVTLVVGWLEPPRKIADRQVRGCDFSASGSWITQQVPFEVREDTEYVQFGIVCSGRTSLTVDYLELIAEPRGSAGENK